MPGGVRHTDPQSSHDAAANAPVHSLQARYLIAIWRMRKPLSTTEIGRFWDMPRDSFSPRTPALLKKGMVFCIGRRPARNSQGRMISMNAYDLTKLGRKVVADWEASQP